MFKTDNISVDFHFKLKRLEKIGVNPIKEINNAGNASTEKLGLFQTKFIL